MGDNCSSLGSGLMSPLRRLNLRSHRGEPGKIWLMSETAPFQVPITAYFLLVGIMNILTGLGLVPGSVSETYPAWLILAWATSTVLGASMSLAGRYMQQFRVESSGLAFLLSACGIYITAVLWVNGLGGIFPALAYTAIGIGCAIRMRVIARHHKAQKLAGEIIQSNGDNPS